MTTQTRKSVLVTGATRGLGRALAEALASDGWTLLLTARNEAALNATVQTLSAQTMVIGLAGDVADPIHRGQLAEAAADLGGLDAVINNAGMLGPSPQPLLQDYPLSMLEQVFRINVVAPLGVLQSVTQHLNPNAVIINVTSDAAVEAYGTWGGYGASKAALEQISAIYAVENPDLHVYWVDPGDMRTDMHQAAFPGEDIGDRPLPATSVPGFLTLLNGHLPSGRYQARQLPITILEV